MDQLPVAIRLLLAGLIDGPGSVFVGAAGACKINLAASSPAGELAAPSHKTMSQTTWYQNRGPASTNFEGTSQSRAACSPIRARTAAMELLKVRRRRRHKALWSRNSPKHGT